MTSTKKWNDTLLDEMRMAGDGDADKIVNDLVKSGQLESANYLMKTLVRYDTPPPNGLPQEPITYLNTTGNVSEEDLKTLKSGQRLFNRYGHLILLILVCGSLPTTYAARKGVRVLRETGRLPIDPNRRLWETAQMVVNVMGPGGLSRVGMGVPTARKFDRCMPQFVVSFQLIWCGTHKNSARASEPGGPCRNVAHVLLLRARRP